MCLGALLFSGALSAILNSDGDGILLVNVSELEYCHQQRSLRHRAIAGQPFLIKDLLLLTIHNTVPYPRIFKCIVIKQLHSQVAAALLPTLTGRSYGLKRIQKNEDLFRHASTTKSSLQAARGLRRKEKKGALGCKTEVGNRQRKWAFG